MAFISNFPNGPRTDAVTEKLTNMQTRNKKDLVFMITHPSVKNEIYLVSIGIIM